MMHHRDHIDFDLKFFTASFVLYFYYSDSYQDVKSRTWSLGESLVVLCK